MTDTTQSLANSYLALNQPIRTAFCHGGIPLYNRTFSNGHLSATVRIFRPEHASSLIETSLQWLPLYKNYISTTARKYLPQGGRWRDVRLYCFYISTKSDNTFFVFCWECWVFPCSIFLDQYLILYASWITFCAWSLLDLPSVKPWVMW